MIFGSSSEINESSIVGMLGSISSDYSKLKYKILTLFINKLRQLNYNTEKWEMVHKTLFIKNPEMLSTLIQREQELLMSMNPEFWKGLISYRVKMNASEEDKAIDFEIVRVINKLRKLQLQTVLGTINQDPQLKGYIDQFTKPVTQSFFSSLFKR